MPKVGSSLSIYPGVSRQSRKKDVAWRARLVVGATRRHLGYFISEEAAGRAVNAARLQEDPAARDDFPGGVFRPPARRTAPRSAAAGARAAGGAVKLRLKDADAARGALDGAAAAAAHPAEPASSAGDVGGAGDAAAAADAAAELFV